MRTTFAFHLSAILPYSAATLRRRTGVPFTFCKPVRATLPRSSYRGWSAADEMDNGLEAEEVPLLLFRHPGNMGSQRRNRKLNSRRLTRDELSLQRGVQTAG